MASIAVLRSPAPSDAMTVLRSMVEAEADYYCLLAEPEAHWKRMQLTAATGFVNVIEGYLADAEIREAVSASHAEQLELPKRVVDGLKKAGVKRDGAKIEKFKRAGLARGEAPPSALKSNS
jgi:hypothetical protein